VLCHVGTLVSFVRFVASEPSLGTRRRRTAAVAGNTLGSPRLAADARRNESGVREWSGYVNGNGINLV
jgi:hypothetical protein